MASEHGDQSGGGEPRTVADPLFESKLHDTGVKAGSGPVAQNAAEQQVHRLTAFATGRSDRPDAFPALPRITFTENTSINPAEILPSHVLEEFSKPERGDVNPERGLQYLAASWQTAQALADDLSLDVGAVFDAWMEEVDGQPAYFHKVGSFSDRLQRRVSEAIDSGLESVPDDQRAKAKQEYLWRRRGAFAPLFIIPLTSGTTITDEKDRRNIARTLSGDKDALVAHLGTSLHSDFGIRYAQGEELLLAGFVVDDELREEHPLAAYAGVLTRPWKERAEHAERWRSGYGGDKNFVLEDEVFGAFVSVAEAHSSSIEQDAMWTDAESAERQRAIAIEPDNLLLIPFPDKVAAYLNGGVPEGSFPRTEIQRYLSSITPHVGLPTVMQNVTRRVYDTEILQLEATETRHEEQGETFLQTLLPKIVEAGERAQSGKPVQVKLDMHAGYTKVDMNDTSGEQERKLHFRVIHGDEPTINWEGDGFARYTDIRDYLSGLNPDAITVESDVDQEYLRGIYSGGLSSQSDYMEERFGATDLSVADIRDRVTAGGYRLIQSRALGNDLPQNIQFLAPRINNLALPFFWRFADQLHQNGNLTSQATEIPLSVADTQIETLEIPANDPYAILKALADSDPVIAAAQVRATNQDISFPEVTIAEGEYSGELMSQEKVYTALDALREQGFTAVLGEKMAEEFSSQAATIYVEHSLPALGYEMPQAPMGTLQEWQRDLVNAARAAGYTGDAGDFVENGYAMTAGKEDEMINFLKARDGKVRVNGWDLSQYRQARQVLERFFDFADESGMSGYKRYSEIPKAAIASGGFDTLRSSSYSISEAATEHFAGKAVDWSLFLSSLPEDAEALPHFGEAYQQMRALGDQLSGELTDMSQGDVITRAKQIIHGEVAAVGEDIYDPISVRTFTDFYTAIRNLLMTPKINLILLKDGTFGWEISTREESSAADRRSYF